MKHIQMNDITKRLLTLIAEQFSINKEDIDVTLGPGDILGWDSIGQLQLILKIEQLFNVSFSIDDVMSINSISDMQKIISQKIVPEEELKTKTNLKSLHPLIQIHTPTNIFAGVDGLSKVFKKENIEKIAIVTGSSSYSAEFFDLVNKSLGEGFSVQRFIKKSGEPTSDEIVKLSGEISQFNAQLVIAVGGGSVIDATKLAWVLYENPELEIEKIEVVIGRARHRHKAKLAVIPTTYGSGSEVSSAAAFNKTNAKSKTIVVSHSMLPDFVFLDANFGLNMPANILFASAIDALTHSIEGYVSLISNTYAENIAIAAIRNIITSLQDVLLRGVNMRNLSQLMYGAYWAGIVQNQCSVGATHSLAHQLNNYRISHGLANSLFLLPVLSFNSEKTKKYQDMVRDLSYQNLDELIIDIKNIIQESKLLENIDVNVLKSNKDIIISGAEKDITFKTNPIQLSIEDLSRIFDQAINSLV